MFIKNIKLKFQDNLVKKYIETSDFKETQRKNIFAKKSTIDLLKRKRKKKILCEKKKKKSLIGKGR